MIIDMYENNSEERYRTKRMIYKDRFVIVKFDMPSTKKKKKKRNKVNNGSKTEIKDKKEIDTETEAKTRKNIKICFAAIFRNESKNVYRCLDGVRSVIDCISICDTGSTDNTIELIERWGKENNIPVRIHHEPFKNFGYNRSLSFKMAKESFPDADYCLFVDADMVLMITDEWNKNTLDKDQYHLKQKSSIIEYWNTRIVRMSLPWVCVGVTHEYWESKPPHTDGNLDTIWIDDKEDGGFKEDKFERDKRLLEAGLNDPEEPEHVRIRYMFYLGQTLRDLDDLDGSIKWYRKRIEAGGWDEEIAYSQMQIGVCYERKESYETAAGAYLEAWQLRPCRSEPLYHLSRMYRHQAKSYLSVMFAMQGSKIPFPKHDRLFVDYRVYRYLFYEEISISAFYIPEMKMEGTKAVRKLLSMKNEIQQSSKDLAISNAKFYEITSR